MNMSRLYRIFGELLTASGVPEPLTSPYMDQPHDIWTKSLQTLYDDDGADDLETRLRVIAGELLNEEDWLYDLVNSAKLLRELDLMGSMTVLDLYEKWFARVAMPK